MKLLSVNTSKGEVRYAVCGSGPKAMIMAPGLSVTNVLENAAAVEKAYADFDGTYAIYLFDYPDCLDKTKIEFLADALAEAIGALGLKNCYYFGVSFGGMVGQILLAKYPGLFARGVLASTVAQMTTALPDAIGRWNGFALKRDVQALNRSFYGAVYSDAYQKQYASAIENALDRGTEKDLRRMALHTEMILQADLSAYARAIKTPVLVITSKADRVFSLKDTLQVARLIGCPLFTYEGFSHAVFDEAPDFKQRVLDWFEEKE